MKVFNKKFLNGLFVLVALFLMALPACTKDDGTDPAPGNNDSTGKFTGTWHVSDNAARLNYDVTIERSTLNPKTEIYMHNFADLGGKIIGRVIGNTVVVDKQETGNENYSVEGTGTFVNSNRLEFTYTLDDNIESEVRNAVFTK